MSYDAIVAHAEANGGPPPGGERIVFGGVEMRKYNIKADTVLISHCHSYDHPAILAQGTAELWTQHEGLRVLEGPCEVHIPKGAKHAVSALTDLVWYCLRPEGVKEGH